MQRGELLGSVLDDQAIEHGLHDALFGQIGQSTKIQLKPV